MAAQLHIIDDTALRDDARLARTVLRQPCDAVSVDSASSTVPPKFETSVEKINQARKTAGLSHEEFCRRAKAGTRNWFRLVRGEQKPTPALLKRLNAALGDAQAARPRPVVKAFHRLVMIEIARAQDFDVAVLLATDFSVQRPHVPDWLAASRIQSMALYITAVELEVGNAELARALGVSREAVRKARNKIEDLRDDAAIDALLNRVAQQVRG